MELLRSKEIQMTKYIKWLLLLSLYSVNTSLAEVLSLDLNKVVELAVERNEKSKIADYELEKAEVNYKEVRSNMFPTIDVGISQQKSTQKPALFSVITGDDPTTNKLFNNYTFGGNISVVQPVYTFGRLSNAVDAAKHQSNLAKTSRKVTAASIKSTVSQLYYNALFYKQIFEVSKESYQNTLSNQSSLEKRISFGRISQDENLKMNADIYSRKPALIEAERQYDNTLSQLKNFLNLQPSVELKLEESLQDLVVKKSVNKDSELDSLAYVSLLKDELSLTQSLESVAKADYYPTLSLVGSYGRTGFSEELFGDSFLIQDTTALGLSLSWSFSIGGGITYAHQKSKIQTAIKRLEYENGKRDLDRGLKSLYAQEEKLSEKKDSLKKAVSLADQSYKVSRRSFANGSLSQTQLNDRELLLTNNKISYATNLLEILMVRDQIKTYLTRK